MTKPPRSNFPGFVVDRGWLALRRHGASGARRVKKIPLRTKLIAMSSVSAAFALIAWALDGFEWSKGGLIWTLVLLGAALGAIVLATLVQRFLARHLSSFRSAKLFGVGLAALATFVAHGRAVGEVNAIFLIDASSLPHAMAAASAMTIGTWLFWAVLVPVTVASFAWLIRCCAQSLYGDATIAGAIFFAGVTWSGLIGNQAAPDQRRESNLYQIALAMDFNKRSHCAGVPLDSEGVVFIGPDQRRAIVAPRKVEIPSRGGFSSLFPQIQIPRNFPIVECQ